MVAESCLTYSSLSAPQPMNRFDLVVRFFRYFRSLLCLSL